MAETSIPYISPQSVSSANKDPLEWNQKKQTMILNLGLTDHSQTGETPTPTRFIRNCEEVGLFQDLQHVNPFDEEFKKAIENSASTSLQVPAEISDDTLHTPQIFPQLEVNSENHILADLHSIEPSFPKKKKLNVTRLDDDDDDDDNSLVIVEADSFKDNKKYQRRSPPEKLALALRSKNTKMRFFQKSAGVTLVPIEKLLNSKQSDKTSKEISNYITEIQRQREANKAAQSRCRKRKQQEFEDMKIENKRLKEENARLVIMNCNLEERIERLQDIVKESMHGNNKIQKNKSTLDDRIPAISKNEVRTNAVSGSVPSSQRSTETTLNEKASSKSSVMKVQNTLVPSPIVPKLVLPLPTPVNNTESTAVQNLQSNLNTIVVLYSKPVESVALSAKPGFKKIMPK